MKRSGDVMKKLWCFIWLAVSASALTSCSVLDSIRQNLGDSPPGYQNPHVNCADCHGTREPKAGKELFPPGADPSTGCLTCHTYRENHHPVDYAPADPAASPFPLYSGKVTCLTCHEIHGGPEHRGTPRLLRGGPYADRRTICFNCHDPEQYEYNPHVMFGQDGSIFEVNGKPVCLVCHVVQPNPYTDRTANVRFRADIGFLCWRCHPPMPGNLLDTHFLVKPSVTTLSYMHASESRLTIILPLAPWGRITCSTCHNPHQKGLLAFAEAVAGADAPKKLRARDMCGACHRK
jgi:predicted CXXCH cytochrome family protein